MEEKKIMLVKIMQRTQKLSHIETMILVTNNNLMMTLIMIDMKN